MTINKLSKDEKTKKETVIQYILDLTEIIDNEFETRILEEAAIIISNYENYMPFDEDDM